MTLNPYDVPSTVSVAQTKRKAIASKMVWAGILLLGFALVCLVFTVVFWVFSFQDAANAESTLSPKDLAQKIRYGMLLSIAVIPLSILGIVSLVAGFLARQSAK